MRLFLLTLLSSVCLFKPQSRNFLNIFPFTFSDLTSFLNKSQLLQANCGHWCSFFVAVQFSSVCGFLCVNRWWLWWWDDSSSLFFNHSASSDFFFFLRIRKRWFFFLKFRDLCIFLSWSGAKWWWRVFSPTIFDISTARRLSLFFPLALLWFRFWVFQMLVAGFPPSWCYFTAET